MRAATILCSVLGAASLGAAACSAGASASAADESALAKGPAQDDLVDRDVVLYAEQCKQELGITAPLPDLSCTDGQRTATGWDASRVREIPITIGGQPVTEATLDQALEQGCDRSQWLEQRCWTYDLMQRVDINPDVEAVLNCRQKYRTNADHVDARKAAAASGDVEKFKLAFEFNDLGYILRNKNTGKSCFFTAFGARSYGGFLPAPDRREMPARDELYAMLPSPKPPIDYVEDGWNRGPKAAFFTPVDAAGGGCIGCHNQGAFKHSPFIDQVSVPGVGRVVPANDRSKPYLLVGRAFQDVYRRDGIFEVDTGTGGENTCVGCHRMASGTRETQDIVEWATGVNVPAPSTWASAWPQRAWMKPNHRKTDEASYRAAYGADIDKMLCCQRTPDARGCLKRGIGPTLADVQLDSDGNLADESWRTSAGTESCEL